VSKLENPLPTHCNGTVKTEPAENTIDTGISPAEDEAASKLEKRRSEVEIKLQKAQAERENEHIIASEKSKQLQDAIVQKDQELQALKSQLADSESLNSVERERNQLKHTPAQLELKTMIAEKAIDGSITHLQKTKEKLLKSLNR
jgi:uncharacterized membrane protein YqiK